jgi:beta-glucosidase
MTRFSIAAATAGILALCTAGHGHAASPRVEALLARMTIDEKVGQLNLVSGHHAVTGPYTRSDVKEAVLSGQAGGLFNVYGAEYTRGLQEMAVNQTRLGIPLLLGFDVLHGYRTVFPIPLGQAASWDLKAIEESDRISAREASAAGVNWIYAPMLDVSRDPRWGRVAEGSGESVWLGAKIAAARVRGLMGQSLAAPDSVLPCAKHFAGNGATEGGREYSGSDISERALRETQLPPFAAAVDAGALCMMAAFNAVDGIPGVANSRLLTDILRGEWKFRGIVVSDFGAVEELTVHGVAATPQEAAQEAVLAGTDIDMESRTYRSHLGNLVRAGYVPQAALDEAVRRVLTVKEELGLFDNPYSRSDPARERTDIGRAEYRAAALSLAEKSLVLLKNADGTLPFARTLKRVAVIGPLGDSGADTLGPWAAHGDPDAAVTLAEGLRNLLGEGAEVTALAAGTIAKSTPAEIAEAVKLARRSEAVILALGEKSTQSGEAASRATIDLPGDQLALARAVLALGRPTAVVLFHGRPLTIEELDREAPAVLSAWFPGSEGGNAIARVLFGIIEPTGRLPMTFPRAVGQIPIYHDALPTGRPAAATWKPYTSAHLDLAPTPLYPFGYGLSYTTFSYGEPRVDRKEFAPGEKVQVSVEVTNTGQRRGTALVQLYIRNKAAKISRPLRELRDFGRIILEPGETGSLSLNLAESDLAYWQPDGRLAVPDKAIVDVMTGPDAGSTQTVTIAFRKTLGSQAAVRP